LSCTLVDTLIITNKKYMATALNTTVRPNDKGIKSGTHKWNGIHPEYMGFTVCLSMAENLLSNQRNLMYFCDSMIKFHALRDYTGHSRVLGTLWYNGVFL